MDKIKSITQVRRYIDTENPLPIPSSFSKLNLLCNILFAK
jgi:hypothetical protein